MRLYVVLLPILLWLLDPLLQWSHWFPTTSQQTLTIFMAAWMVTWWVTEILPLGVTAMVPMVFLPLSGILPLKQVTADYANPVIYLFLGGFILARGLEKTRLNERIALSILSVTGKSDRGILLGFMIATGFLSMWISNTATTVMMLPIAMSVLEFMDKNVSDNRDMKAFSVAVLLSIAYSANIGGIVTPIGTPPNVVLVGYLDELYSINIDFWRWMLVALPVALALSACQYFLMRKRFTFSIPVGERFLGFVREKHNALGPVDKRQKITLLIFSLTCFLWVFKEVIHKIFGVDFLNDTSIAIMAGLLLFLIPEQLSSWKPVLEKDDIGCLPWNIILLFGGGMAMAGSLKDAGVIQMTTDALSQYPFESAFFLVLVLSCVTLFLTEIMSNVALCVVALPVMMNLGQVYGLPPALIGIPAAICASFAFSLPISTPPNAIVFGTNQIRVTDMLKVGIILNLLGIAVVMSVGWLLLNLLIK